MPNLSTLQIAKLRKHLGYNSRAVPIGYQTLFKKAIELPREQDQIDALQELIERCDRVFEQTEITKQGDGVASRRLLTGDVNRTDIEYRPENWRTRKRAYVYETDQLGAELGVTNFRSPANKDLMNFDVAFIV
jgi:hypothetical protein